MLRVIGLRGERMKVDISVRAIFRAQAAPDAPILNDDLQRIAPADRSDGTAHHAQRIAALPAGRCHQEIFKAQPFAYQARHAIMRISARRHAGVPALFD